MNAARPVDEFVEALIATSGLDASGSAGEPATSPSYRVDAERTVAMLADVLAQLHARPVELLGRVALDPREIVQRARGAPESSRSEPYRHMDTGRLLEILAEGADAAASDAPAAVLTHGAPTLANLWCARGAALGLVSWEHAAVADPYRDLAVAARSVADDLTPHLVPVLLAGYSSSRPDALRLDWYALAAELSQ